MTSHVYLLWGKGKSPRENENISSHWLSHLPWEIIHLVSGHLEKIGLNDRNSSKLSFGRLCRHLCLIRTIRGVWVGGLPQSRFANVLGKRHGSGRRDSRVFSGSALFGAPPWKDWCKEINLSPQMVILIMGGLTTLLTQRGT